MFAVNNSAYVKLNNDVLEKAFTHAVEGAYKIVKIAIPEADLENNIHAIFVIASTGKTVAKYNNGSINLIK